MVQAKAVAAAKVTPAAAPRGNNVSHERPAETQKAKSSPMPANFFDNQGTKRQRDGENAKTSSPPLLAS